MAAFYDAEGADELVFLDITASSDERNIMIDVVNRVSEQVFIPLTVGGGIRTTEDMRRIWTRGLTRRRSTRREWWTHGSLRRAHGHSGASA